MSENADRLRLAVQLFNQHGLGMFEDRDLRELLKGWVDPEIECFSDNPMQGGSYRGYDGFERFIREWNEAWEEPHWEIEDLVERGDAMVAVIRHTARGSASGVDVDSLFGFYFVNRDGRLTRWGIYTDPADAMAQLH